MDSWTGTGGTMRSILGIDTASPHGSVALITDGVLRAMVSLPPGGHSSGLAGAAEQLAQGAGIALASLSGAGSARRSILPLALSGNCSSSTKRAGTM